jgi:hypothetical protein
MALPRLIALLDWLAAPAFPAPPTTEIPPVPKIIGDELASYESAQADAKTKADAAVAADKAASDAATLAATTEGDVASDLHTTGPVFTIDAAQAVKVYSSTDGKRVSVTVPKPATTVVPDATPAP